MIIPDINLLIYAIDSSSPFHSDAVTWLQEILSEEENVGLPGVVLFGFIRISTNPRVFKNPLTVQKALGHVHEWLAQPCAQYIDVDETSFEAALKLVEANGTAGNLVSDAQIAALALEHQAVLHTADTDFKRFPGLRTFNPLLPQPNSKK